MPQVIDIEALQPLERARAPRREFGNLGVGKAMTMAALGLAFVLGAAGAASAQTPPPSDYPPPPPGYAPPPVYAEPVAPPGAIWVGAPGQCLYGNGQVYWCAPGVVFDGFPPGWDFVRFPVFGFGPAIIVDPIWFGRWRVGHPRFAFHGRFATEGERRAFAAHRGEIIRNGAMHGGEHPAPERHEERR
jgi:hypothetical protein